MEDNKCLKVYLFGGLRLEWGEKTVFESGGRLKRPQELLVLLILTRKQPVANEQLAEAIWGYDESENPAGALKNAAYSLRRQLNTMMPGQMPILSVNRSYQWNPEIPVWTDVEAFRAAAEQLLDKKEGADLPKKERIRLGLEAAGLYSGDLLPGIAEKEWVMQRTAYLRQSFIEVVCSTAELLLEDGDRRGADTAVNLCNRATIIEPLCEETYVYLFRAMKKLEMKSTILKYYPMAANLFWEELGVHMPEEVRDIYHWAAGDSENGDKDINYILSDLNGVTRAARPLRGAYLCPYEVFVHMFHMVARNASREKSSVVLMLLTLHTVSGDASAAARKKIQAVMEQLKSVVHDNLRKGDVFSQYSRNQLVLMLSVKQPGDCTVVENRLRTAFANEHPPLDVTLEMISGIPEQLV